MPLTANKARARFTLTGGDIAPLGVISSPPDDRRAFWRFVALAARDEVIAMLKKSIGVDGKALKHRKRARRDFAVGPVLIPHVNDSRFLTQLRWQGTDRGAVIWWRYPWGKIVSYHARGIKTRNMLGQMVRVVRDVVGLTNAALERVKERAAKWWASRLKRGAPVVQSLNPTVFTVNLSNLPSTVRLKTHAVATSKWSRPSGARTGARPVRVPEPPQGPMPPWELQRRVSATMDAAARQAVSEGQREALLSAIRETQDIGVVRDVLRRLGVTEPARTWDEAIELLRKQIVVRGGGPFPVPFVRPPAPPRPPAPVPTPPAPTPPAEIKPVSDALRWPWWGAKETKRLTTDAIDQIHDDGKLPRIPIQKERSKFNNGAFWRTDTGIPIKITYQTEEHGEHPELTLLHEIGHFIDLSGLPGEKEFASVAHPALEEFRRAVMASRSFESIKKARTMTGNMVIGRLEDRNMTADQYFDYLMSPKELWARAYAQYIAVQSGEPKLLGQLDGIRDSDLELVRSKQWADDDFAPIALAINRLFTSLGWMK